MSVMGGSKQISTIMINIFLIYFHFGCVSVKQYTNMDVESVFVTGANRGIGLEFVRQLTKLPKPPRFIFATYRDIDAALELKKLRDETKETQIFMIQMDVIKVDQIQAARKIVEDIVGDRGLTLLINNAGLGKMSEFPTLTEETLIAHFKINTIGPILVLQEFLPLLEKAADRQSKSQPRNVSRAAVIKISSLYGCITLAGLNRVTRVPMQSYKISKAGLNMAMREISADVNDKGILVVMMCPGWVKTDMGGEDAELDLHQSISCMLKTFATLNDSHHGVMMSREGEIYEF